MDRKGIFCFFLLSTSLCFSSEEGFVNKKYRPEQKSDEEYRVYDEETSDHVREFYLSNHRHQTLDFVRKKKEEYLTPNRAEMSIWEAISLLDTIIDESDPDLDLPQSHHLFQTAEALRKDGHPRWLILTAFIHDLGKILLTFGEPQWAVVGDTFPVGCRFSDKVIYPEFFEKNVDFSNPEYIDELGIYERGCGLDQLEMSWGHDEYLYHVVKDYLSDPALFIIRYHSLYSVHKRGAYSYFYDEKDREMMKWLKLFSQYDLYSKDPEPVCIEEVLPYYQELVSEFFPEKLHW